MTQQDTPTNTWAFFLVWIGQLISLFGSNLTGFALVIWTYQETHSVIQTSLVLLCSRLPSIIIAPIAGALVDRWERRWTMFCSDAAAGLMSLILALLIATGRLELWHIYLSTAVYAIGRVFQEPAYTAATTLLVPPEHYGRASGMVQLAGAIGEIGAPVVAGVLVPLIYLTGIIAIDILTYFVALITLLLVRFPRPKPSTDAEEGQGSLLREATYGWRYITAHRGMISLLLFFMAMNFVAGFVNTLAIPLVLSFSSSERLGLIMSGGGIGLLIGSIVMSTWGGPKRRVLGMIGATAVIGVFLMMMGLQADELTIGLGIFGVLFAVPILEGCNQAIWQSKVPADLQGRAFATQRMVALAAMPISMLLAGPLADRLFEPLLARGGPLARSVGALIGVGPGRGIGFFYILLGLALVLLALGGALYRPMRLIEEESPQMLTTSALAESQPTDAQGALS
jgi:MFS transporter, DHA3 family, macrolide efflux protein